MFAGLLAFVLSVALLAQADQPTLTHQVPGFSGEAKAVALRTEQGSVTALRVGGSEPSEL